MKAYVPQAGQVQRSIYSPHQADRISRPLHRAERARAIRAHRGVSTNRERVHVSEFVHEHLRAKLDDRHSYPSLQFKGLSKRIYKAHAFHSLSIRKIFTE